VSYFPLLVAGPIEATTHLLPQVKVKRTFDFEKSQRRNLPVYLGLLKVVIMIPVLLMPMQSLIII
jgi:D-alanyl-lipoteichoic acid acyltransferase DltB (MBOAT superfamily)